MLAKTSAFEMGVKDGMLDEQLQSKSSFLSSRSQSLPKDCKNSGKKHQEKFGRSSLMIGDIKDAVELSIGASEALVISEIVKKGYASEVSPVSAVLEMALHLKQTRNSWCTNGWDSVSDCEADQVDETNLLQDLDEDIMADAYEDVGLSISPVVASLDDLHGTSPVLNQRCRSSETVSRVPDTPGSKNYCACDTEVQNVNLEAHEVVCDVISSERKFQNVLQENLPSAPACAPHLVLNTSSADRYLQPYLNLSAQANSNIATMQGVNIGIADTRDLHKSESMVSSSWVRESGNDGAENEVFCVVSDRFKSRWLGGWTGKDFGVPVEMGPNTSKRVPESVIMETSYISESADVFPDENSFANNLERRPLVTSLPSVVCQGLCNGPNKEILLSQGLVTLSNLSLEDPLCSVVPCSISSDNANGAVATNQKDIEEEEAGNRSNLPLEHGLENLNTRTTRLHEESGLVENVISSEGTGATSRKQSLKSLKCYSMLLPHRNTHGERKSAYCNGSAPTTGILGLLSSEKNIDCFKSSIIKDSAPNQLSEPISKCSSGKGEVYEEGLETFSVGLPDTKLKNDKKGRAETANDEAELQLLHQENRCSPIILNRRTHHHVKAVLSNVVRDENSEKACMTQSMMVPIPILHSTQHPNPCEAQGPSKKRVHFSETVVNKFQRSRNGLKSRSEHHQRSNTRAAKRLKKCGLGPDLRSQEDNKLVKELRMKDRKRMIFQGLEFFLIGLTSQIEREIEILIREHEGFVVSDVPPPPDSGRCHKSRCKLRQLPIFLSPKKLKTTKFLYGCALNAFMLKVDWLTDSIGAGSLLPPEKYTILPNRDDLKHQRIGQPVRYATGNYIFNRVGIIFHGKHNSCTKLAKIVKHGGGQVFKTLQWLLRSLNNGKISVGTIVAEDEGGTSRHLRQCAFEKNIRIMPVSWIIDSLLLGKLIPAKENNPSFPSVKITAPDFVAAMELSQEI